jgi:hypothetical protein
LVRLGHVGGHFFRWKFGVARRTADTPDQQADDQQREAG